MSTSDVAQVRTLASSPHIMSHLPRPLIVTYLLRWTVVNVRLILFILTDVETK